MHRTQDQFEELLNRYPLEYYPLQSHGYIPSTSDYRIRLSDQQGVVTFIFKDVIEVHEKLTARLTLPEEKHDSVPETPESLEIEEDSSSSQETTDEAPIAEAESPVEAPQPDEEISDDELAALFEDPEALEGDQIDSTHSSSMDHGQTTAEDPNYQEESPSTDHDAIDTSVQPPTPRPMPRMLKRRTFHLASPYWYYVEFSERAREWSLRFPNQMHEVVLVTPFLRLSLIFRDVSVKHEPHKQLRHEDSFLSIAG
ncbi:MAG: hypothetical protein ACQETE_12365 [Bacteroidota bacterium]